MVRRGGDRSATHEDDDDEDEDALLNLAAQELKKYIKRCATLWLVGVQPR
jgi:hypothetical protein